MERSEASSRTVLHLVSRLGVGGVENQLSLVVQHYDRNRFQPLICCLRQQGEIGREMEEAGIEVIYLGRDRIHQFDPRLVMEIAQLLRKRRIDILRTHQYEPGLYGRLAGLLTGTPLVISSYHNIYRRRKWHRHRINRFLSRFTDHVVAVSECVKGEIVRYDCLPPDRVRVIYNGVDPRRFQDQVREGQVKCGLGLPSNCRIVGTVGRMTVQKGHELLLEAFAELKGGRELRLLLVGDGPRRPWLEQRTRELGLQDRVCFAGFRRDIYPLLRAMDIFVLPSRWEGLPGAVIEAMATGRPVVASDLPPLREIVSSPEIGILVRPGEKSQLREALADLLEDRGASEEMGRRAREYALSRFPIQRTVSSYQDLFAEGGRKGGKRTLRC